jgi:hypothetical protein
MGKEIIHIEVDEDIAGIIGRVMAAEEKVVAVVAPKNLGALRSAMNLKLLKKAAKNAGKIVAVVSDNPAMKGLAGAAQVPLAANLESTPEIPEAPAAVEGQLVAEELTTGEALTIADGSDDSLASRLSSNETARALAPLSPDGDSPRIVVEKSEAEQTDSPSSDGDTSTTAKKRRFTALTAKVDKVWQKALIIGGVVVGAVAIGILVLFLLVKPSATVNIATQMDTIDVRSEVRFKTDDNNVEGGLFRLTEKSLGVEQSQEFEATGEKFEGTRASGQITIRYCGPSQTITSDQWFEVGGKKFRLSNTITLEGTACGGEWRSTTAVVTADDIGEEYNVASGTDMILSTDRNGYQTGVKSNGIAGGSKQTVKVVSEDDVKNALSQMDSASIEEGRSRLKASLPEDVYAFDLTFISESGSVEVMPKVGETVAAGAKATVKRTQNYKIMTASKPDMEQFARSLAEAQADGKKIYEIGRFQDGDLFLERVAITSQTGGTTCPETPVEGEPECVPKPGVVKEVSALLKTVAKAGDEISESEIKAVAQGQRVNDANRLVMEVRGVQRVDISLKPFWANRLPKDGARITVNIEADK